MTSDPGGERGEQGEHGESDVILGGGHGRDDLQGGVPAEGRRAGAQVYVDDLERPILGPDDEHHLRRVLRLRPGEAVSVCDGRGGWRLCALGPSDVLDPLGAVIACPAPAPRLSVAFALPKADRPEWAVQKLTEIGVDRIILMTTARSIVRWDAERAVRHLARLRSVARHAAMQSRRACVPSVEGPLSFDDVLASGEAGLALAEPGGARGPGLDRPTLLVGPEGGWSPEELSAGLRLVTLGPTVLRSETAAVVAGGLLTALRSGIVARADA